MLRDSTPARIPELEPLLNPGQVTGFSSPAQDYKQHRLNVIQRLVGDPGSTYYFVADTDELLLEGIGKGAILVVDQSLPVNCGRIVVARHDGEWLARKLVCTGGIRELVAQNSAVPCISVTAETLIFGMVTWSCNPLLTKVICLR